MNVPSVVSDHRNPLFISLKNTARYIARRLS